MAGGIPFKYISSPIYDVSIPFICRSLQNFLLIPPILVSFHLLELFLAFLDWLKIYKN